MAAKTRSCRSPNPSAWWTLLKKAGVQDVKLTVYPEAEHDSWTETYKNPELYDWLLQHERGK